MIVFLVSGLWHGAGWTYVLWGGLNGLYQVAGDMLRPWREKVCRRLNIDTNVFSHRILQMLITFALIDFSWIFFRAEDIRSAFGFIARMFTGIRFSALFDQSLLGLGLDGTEFFIAICAIGVLLCVSLMHDRGIHLRETLARQGIWFRWMIYLIGIFSVLIFGVYGPGFNANQFIYFQF